MYEENLISNTRFTCLLSVKNAIVILSINSLFLTLEEMHFEDLLGMDRWDEMLVVG